LRLDNNNVSLAEPAFYFNRARLWWRFWNLKIILFRQLFLRRAVERGKETVPAQMDQVDEQCMRIAVQAASATVASIDQYTKRREITRLVTWYSM
jgi:transcriptional regulatory protein GAL4